MFFIDYVACTLIVIMSPFVFFYPAVTSHTLLEAKSWLKIASRKIASPKIALPKNHLFGILFIAGA